MVVILLLLSHLYGMFPYAQPENDDCESAIELSLTIPPECPGGSSVTDDFTFDNVGATSTTLYPIFSGCDPGETTNVPSVEVWFVFTAVGHSTNITVGGLITPNIVVYAGNDCGFLNTVACAREDSSVTLELTTLVETQYYISVSGGDVNDQGVFTMEVESSRDCTGCLVESKLIATPPPVYGAYSSGQEVYFCYEINYWDTTVVAWLHSVTLEFGEGWDETSLIPAPPASCDGQGTWSWYEEWVSENNGQTFGPGFAYESSLQTGGENSSSNPGDNWGDGSNGCADIGTLVPAVNFCWTIAVKSCEDGNFTGNSLNISATAYSDGDSGDWHIQGCQSGATNGILASTVCCDDSKPEIIETVNETCPDACDGTAVIMGNGTWNFNIFDSDNNILFNSDADPDPISVTSLCAGTYSVMAENTVTGCNVSDFFDIGVDPRPVAFANNGNPACPDEIVELYGNTPSTGITHEYHWTGPDGYESFEQNPKDATLEGIYMLVVTIDGCSSDQVETEVIMADESPEAIFSTENTILCLGESVQFLNQSSDNSYSFEWYFSGGSPEETNEFHPSVAYAQAGIFDVMLIANNICGSDSLLIPAYIQVSPLPVASFEYSADSIKLSFENTSMGEETYFWDFGDGITSTEENPEHWYLKAGNYLVKFTVTNECGATTHEQEVKTEGSIPQAVIITDVLEENCVPFEVQFTDGTTGIPASWQWSFPGGNPQSSTEQNPLIIYDSAGVYDVTLDVSNGFGESAITESSLITALQSPTALFSLEQDGRQIFMQNLSIGSQLEYKWDFGDGTASIEKDTTTYQYQENGVYIVSLTASNFCGSDVYSDTLSILVDTKEKPVFSTDLKIVPNPSTGRFGVTIKGIADNYLKIRLIDIWGRHLFEERFDYITGHFEEIFDFEYLPSGVFLLQVETTNKVVSQKVLIE